MLSLSSTALEGHFRTWRKRATSIPLRSARLQSRLLYLTHWKENVLSETHCYGSHSLSYKDYFCFILPWQLHGPGIKCLRESLSFSMVEGKKRLSKNRIILTVIFVALVVQWTTRGTEIGGASVADSLFLTVLQYPYASWCPVRGMEVSGPRWINCLIRPQVGQ